MADKFQVKLIYPDGETDLDDEIFDDYDDAVEHGLYLCSCYSLGGEQFYLSNPGDYPLDNRKARYKVVKARR